MVEQTDLEYIHDNWDRLTETEKSILKIIGVTAPENNEITRS